MQQPISSSSSSGGSYNGAQPQNGTTTVTEKIPHVSISIPKMEELIAKPPIEKKALDLRPSTVIEIISQTNSFTGPIGQVSSSMNLANIKELTIEPTPKENGENHFYTFFQEMNEKASEAISRSDAEPERALEFLKQAESFLKKIEKSRKATNIKTEVN